MEGCEGRLVIEGQPTCRYAPNPRLIALSSLGCGPSRAYLAWHICKKRSINTKQLGGCCGWAYLIATAFWGARLSLGLEGLPFEMSKAVELQGLPSAATCSMSNPYMLDQYILDSWSTGTRYRSNLLFYSIRRRSSGTQPAPTSGTKFPIPRSISSTRSSRASTKGQDSEPWHRLHMV